MATISFDWEELSGDNDTIMVLSRVKIFRICDRVPRFEYDHGQYASLWALFNVLI
jgi:hypothetical protein